MGIFERTIIRSMDFPVSEGLRSIDPNMVNLNKNTVYQRYFDLDLRGPEVEVPVLIRKKVENILAENHNRGGYSNSKSIESLKIPLFVGLEQEKRTSNSVIRAMFETSIHDRLTKVKTTSGLTYYGGAGIIFNENMDCLFLSTVKYRFEDDLKLIKSTAYINPKVFMSNNPIEKTIIKKLIPTLITEKVFLTSWNTIVVNLFNYPDGEHHNRVVPDIVISDISDRFISKPDMPDLSQFSDDEVNSFLYENYYLFYNVMNL